MPTPRTCAQCGASLLTDAPDGLCPTCGFHAALKASPKISAEFHPSSLFDPPSAGAMEDSTSPLGEGRGEGERVVANPKSKIDNPKIRYFGDYELLEEIARGGMGVVYRARQVSLNRTVAVKMILSGQLASAADLQRFRAEAKTAANLQHPNIVAIHEVGEHDGQHYFSMDCVEGKNLTALVRDNPLPARTAAGYLKAIAAAIHYAHQRGVVHRDLKPSNVLIDVNDQPRVTDFGLAKRFGVPALGVPAGENSKASQSSNTQPAAAGTSNSEPGTRNSELTLSGQVLGSPNFMPPEQATGKRGRVGPHSDVYSLGAILYHLLTGRPPFVAETLTDTLQQLLHTDPVSPRLLNPSVPRDLETICLKCLEKEPRQRYAAAQDLAEDLGRFLSGESVHARPIGRTARCWRWCRRKPALAGALAACVLVLTIGIAGITWQWRRAEQNAARSQQVALFLKEMLKGVGPSVALGRDTKMLREILDKTAERLGKDLRDQPAVEAELRDTIGEVYLELGEYVKAEAMFREALALQKNLLGNEHSDAARSLNNLGVVLAIQGKYAEAEMLAREALDLRKKLLGHGHKDVAESLNNLAAALNYQKKHAEAAVLFREALTLQKKLLGNEHPDVARSLNNLGVVLSAQSNYSDAEAMFRETLDLRKKLFGNAHPDVAISLINLAGALREQGKNAEAEPLLREALALQKKLLGNEHPNVAFSLNNLAVLLHNQRRYAEAEGLFREALAIREKKLGNEHPSVDDSRDGLADALWRQAKYAEAEALLRGSLAMKRKLLGNDDPEVARSLNNLAAVLNWEGNDLEAETLDREALAILKKRYGNEHLDVALLLRELAVVLVHQGKYTEAEALHLEALAVRKKLLRLDHPDVADSLNKLTELFNKQGKYAEAEVFCRERLAIARKTVTNNVPIREARSYDLAEVLYRQQKYAEAEPLYREVLLSRRNRLDAGHDDVIFPAASFGRLLSDWAWHEHTNAPLADLKQSNPELAPELEPWSASSAAASPAAHAREAERLLRDCLAIRLRGTNATHWRTSDMKSRLGGALVALAVTEPGLATAVRQSNLAQAETLLLEGTEELERSRSVDLRYWRDAIERLVRLYETWDTVAPNTGKSAQAEEWKKKLEAFRVEAEEDQRERVVK